MKKTKILFAIWGVVVVIVIGLLTTLGFILKNRTETYRVLEEKIIDSAKDYAYYHVFFDPEDSEVTVTSEELIELGFLDNLEVNDDVCTGYVVIKNENVKEYEGYITCGKYTTKGYQEK